MTQYCYIEPRDTVILRDGRPTSGATTMGCLPFPWPSTIAGVIRTNCGLVNGVFKLDPDKAKEISVHGPWLCELDNNDNIIQYFFPAPQDLVWIKGATEDLARRFRLCPNNRKCEDQHILGNFPNDLEPIWPVNDLPDGKPAKGMPAFWSLEAYKQWLTLYNADDISEKKIIEWQNIGLAPLAKETRMHVSIDYNSHADGTAVTYAALDGQLFSTDALRFTAKNGKKIRRFAIALQCDDSRINEQSVIFGGKGTLSFLQKINNNEIFEDMKNAVLASIEQNGSKRLRVILVTPALFKDGYLPKDKMIDGAKVVAVRCERGQFISGFDFATRRPKVARRMVPAGAVYWVEFEDSASAKKWAQEHWMTCISDNGQDCKDGFGLCLIGRGE